MKTKIFFNSLFFVALIVIALGFMYLYRFDLKTQAKQNELVTEQLKIQKEGHILSLYSAYKGNMDSCKAEAQKAKKEDEFIKANCIEAINSSVLGQSLKEWGKESLLITK